MTVRVFAMVVALGAATFGASSAAAADVWHVKCFAEDGHTMAVKAITADGTTLDIKALTVDDRDYMDVKVLPAAGDAPLAVKVVSPDGSVPYSDVKAIDATNQLVPVKAITATGATLPVKAFPNAESGLFDIKCLGANDVRLGIKAISPSGDVYDVKGIRDLPGEEIEIDVQAHVKAVP